MHDLLILVASMSGTAEFVADELEQALSAEGFAPTLVAFSKLTPDRLGKAELALVCSSTYGVGEVPEAARPFLARLEAERPDLSRLNYGVVTLGDMKYPATFAGGGRTFDRVLTELGGRRVGELCVLDASSGQFPEEVALAWLEPWIASVRAA